MRPIVHILGDVCGAVNKEVLPTLQAVEPSITGVRYDYGHWVEISAKLQDMTQHREQRFNKFPLIMVIEDIPVSNNRDYPSVTLQVYILYWTSNNYTSSERQDKVFTPILEPIYKSFIKQLERSWDIVTPTDGRFAHTRLDRKNYGTQGIYGNNGHITNEFVDVIEIQNIELSFFNKNC